MNTAAEQEVLEEINKARERGEDPFGDEDDDEPVIAGGEQEQKAEAATSEAAPDGEQPNEQQADVQPPPDVQYKAEVPAEHKAQRAELLKAKAEAMKKLMDGEIGAEEFAAEESRISDQLEDLTARRIRAETLIEANQQMQAQNQQRALQSLVVAAKAQVDYMADPKAQKQFDVALQALGADTDNATLDYADLIQEAHKVVCALRGIPASKGEQVAKAVQSTGVQSTVSRQPKEPVPVTLRNIPAAATANANGDMLEQMGRLTGQAYEDAFSRLSPAQRRSLLDEAE